MAHSHGERLKRMGNGSFQTPYAPQGHPDAHRVTPLSQMWPALNEPRQPRHRAAWPHSRNLA